MGKTLKTKETYPYEYVIKNGIPHEDYLAMPEDEKNLKFPYGAIVMSGLTVAITQENHQAMLENERKLTDELMVREGMEVNYELRAKFPNSYFYQICYDDAIIGVNPITQSITYDWIRFGELRIMFVEWIYPSYKDVMYGAQSVMSWTEELSPEELNGKVAPSLVLLDNDHLEKYWDDLHSLGW
jgi:hypothetical protein